MPPSDGEWPSSPSCRWRSWARCYVTLWTAPRAFWLLLINLAAVAVGTLAEEVAFRGYPFRRLIEAIGPVGATLTMSLLFA